MIGISSRPDWLETDWVLGQFGNTRGEALMDYIHFVRAWLDQPSAWESLQGQIYLGSEAFVERMQILVSDRSAVAEIPHMQRRPLAKPLEFYRDTIADSKTAMAAAYATGDYTMQEIATFFRVHYATVSRAVKKHES